MIISESNQWTQETVNDEHKTKIDQLIPSLSFWSAANQSFPVSTSLPKSCHPNPLPAVHGATRFFGMLRQICLIKNYINYGPGLIKIQIQSFSFISNLRKRETFCLLLLGDTSEIRPLQTANPLLTARS